MRNIRPHHVISLLAAGGITLAALNFNSPAGGQPLFSNLDQFVLAAEDGIHLGENVQVSSRDIVANKEISIAENNIINGNLFGDDIKIAENAAINGNASFNKLKLAKNSQILGATSTPLTLPVIQLPSVPDFLVGTQNLVIKENQTINPGDLDKVEVKENITLILNPGTYNFGKLELRTSSKLLFSGKTTINVKDELKINEKVLIAPTANLSPTDLQINFAGDKPVTIGKESFISFKLLAPKSAVYLGERNSFRGQILAKEIKVAKESLLSLELAISSKSNPDKIVTDPSGDQLIVNEVLILLVPGATALDAHNVATSINGRIIGFVNSINLYQIEVTTTTLEELKNILIQLRTSNNPRIQNVLFNSLLELL